MHCSGAVHCRPTAGFDWQHWVVPLMHTFPHATWPSSLRGQTERTKGGSRKSATVAEEAAGTRRPACVEQTSWVCRQLGKPLTTRAAITRANVCWCEAFFAHGRVGLAALGISDAGVAARLLARGAGCAGRAQDERRHQLGCTATTSTSRAAAARMQLTAGRTAERAELDQ